MLKQDEELTEEPQPIATCDECGKDILGGRGDYNRWRGRELHGRCVAAVIRRETADCQGCKEHFREEDAA